MSIKQFIKNRPRLYNALFMICVYGTRQVSFWFKYLLRVVGINTNMTIHSLCSIRTSTKVKDVLS